MKTEITWCTECGAALKKNGNCPDKLCPLNFEECTHGEYPKGCVQCHPAVSPSVIEGALPGLPEGSRMDEMVMAFHKATTDGDLDFVGGEVIKSGLLAVFKEYGAPGAASSPKGGTDCGCVVHVKGVGCCLNAPASPKGWEPMESAPSGEWLIGDWEATNADNPCRYGFFFLTGEFTLNTNGEECTKPKRWQRGPASPGEAQTNKEAL